MIILASKSKARRAILKKLGIKFRVVPAEIKETRRRGRSPSRIVRYNALMKARDVAARVKHGIVVGCDTLVEQNGKIFGKPKNLKDAQKMLKRLSSKPHCLYTGIALIDTKNKREVVNYEKTQILMERLSDKEIKRYFKKVNPLDKAGGFDIQRLGGLFIPPSHKTTCMYVDKCEKLLRRDVTELASPTQKVRRDNPAALRSRRGPSRCPGLAQGFSIRRIKGCYFNIVGLPVSKLYQLLKKVGVSLLFIICAITFMGCTTEFNVATGRQDWSVYSTDNEVSLGDALSKQVEKNYSLVNDPELNERLRSVGERVASVCDRKALIYRFRIIEDEKDKDIVNAFALPGGYIYCFKNLLNEAQTDDELACVLAHEVAHVVARHSIKRLQAIWGFNFLTLLAAGTQDAKFVKGAQVAYMQILTGYSQEDELLADRLAARYAKRAGYNPGGMLTFLAKLRKRHRKEDPRPLSYFKTHPYVSQRIRVTKEEIGEKISFDDFINTF